MLNHKKTFSKTVLKIVTLLITTTFTVGFLHAEIYVWTDENGNKVYGDEPNKSDHAKPVELEPLTVLQFPKAAEEAVASTPAHSKQAYSALTITNPIADQTIRDSEGSVSVSLNIEPALAEGHSIQLYLDGAPYQSPQTSMSFTLSNVDRGTHTLSAKVLDDSGKSLIQARDLSFHMHRFFKAK
jgi:Domain of unknown function (DUF4124)